jgi:hypothetical protein
MKRSSSAKDSLKNKNSSKKGILRNICKVIHRSTDDLARHPMIIILTLISTLLVTWMTIRMGAFTFDQPTQQLRADVAKTVINMRLKIVDISEGCKSTNSYSQVLQQNNRDRLDLVGQLVAIAKGGDVKKNLGFTAQQELACFIKYNDMLSMRANICDGDFLTENEMKLWEEKIISSLYHKSNKDIKCPYGNNP